MSRKLLITALLAATASIATAQPAPSGYDRPDPRYNAPPPRPRVQARRWYQPNRDLMRPVLLAENVRVYGRTAIPVQFGRRFNALELRSTHGRTRVQSVVIRYSNGTAQRVNLNAVLRGGETVRVDLAGRSRSIERIIVVGRTGRAGGVDVVAI